MENRFKLARTRYNQHGKQSVAAVHDNTGISASLIDELETDTKHTRPRGVSYLTVAELAKYYGVSCDYLTGLSDEPSIDFSLQAISKYTGLVGSAIKSVQELSNEDSFSGGGIATLNRLLSEQYNYENPDTLCALIYAITDWRFAIQARDLCRDFYNRTSKEIGLDVFLEENICSASFDQQQYHELVEKCDTAFETWLDTAINDETVPETLCSHIKLRRAIWKNKDLRRNLSGINEIDPVDIYRSQIDQIYHRLLNRAGEWT